MIAAESLVTALGDAFVASAVALVMLAWLWSRLGGLIALAFGVCFSGVWGLTMALKLIAREAARPLPIAGAFDLSQGAPSGHMALAGFVFVAAAAVFLTLDRRPLGWAAAGLSLLAPLGVAVSRVTLQVHTVADVLAGVPIAALGVFVFARALRVQAGGRTIPCGGLLTSILIVAALALASGVRISSYAFM